MRKGQDRKVNSVGRASCLGLLALGLMLVSPVSSSSVFAEGEEAAGEFSDEARAEAGILATQADTPSTVGISFSPARYYAELAPTDNAGQSARIDLQTTIYVYNSGGYSVYLKSDNPNLVGEKNSSNFIPGATVAKSYTDMDVNTWGYAWAVDEETVSNDATYKAVAASGNGDKLAENTSDDIEVDTKTIALSFATKINNEKPADTYSNTMMLSVVSSPREVVTNWAEITTMQRMTSSICASASSGDSKQLKDTRDGKFYWVSKLADGNCWMTQNLDLDLSTARKLTSADSDVSAVGYVPVYNTVAAADGSLFSDSVTGQHSWSLGDYRITNPNASSNCGTKKNSAANCTSQFTAYATPTTANGDVNAHYILGNHYEWDTATVGTGGSITSGIASNSICPKGWRLPTSGSGGELATLVAKLGGTSSPNNVTRAPFYGVRGGYVDQYVAGLFNNAGYEGSYWSSTPVSNGGSAYALYFYSTTGVEAFNSWGRGDGVTVRCVAR